MSIARPLRLGEMGAKSGNIHPALSWVSHDGEFLAQPIRPRQIVNATVQ